MNTEVKKLLNILREANIKVSLKDDNLQIKSYGQKIAPALVQQLKANKAELIAYLKENNAHTDMEITKAAEQKNYPMSLNQRRLWVISQYEDMAGLYNIHDYRSLPIGCDTDIFKKAVTACIERHEVLRTIFKENHLGEVRQWIIPVTSFNLSIEEKDVSVADNPKAAMVAYIDEDAKKPFVLSEGPLIRICLFKLAENTYTFYFCIHHLVFDGWSSSILLQDIMTLYQSFALEQVSPLPELPIQYKDFSVWQLEQLTSGKYEPHKAYWKDRLSGSLGLINLPTNKVRPRIMSHEGHRLSMAVSKEHVEKLKAFCTKEGTSLYTGLVAILKVLLYKYTGQTDILVGTSTADRFMSELETQIGFYVNTIVLRNQLEGNTTFLDFFSKIKKSILSDFSHQEYPFDKVVEDINITRDPSRSALFDVFITYLNIETKEKNSEFHEDGIKDNGLVLSKFDLDIGINVISDLLHFDVTYNTSVYEEAMIVRFMEHFRNLLQVVLEAPNESIDAINILTEEERTQQLEDFNPTVKELVHGKTILSYFKEQVAKTPENIAVSYENRSLTYQELDTQTDQLAAYLLSRYTIEPNTIIGIHLSRNETVVVAILAILKAGGAYLPIATDIPEDRKKHMLNDSDVSVVITEATYAFDMDYFEGELFALDVEDEYLTEDVSNFTPKASVDNLAYIIYTSGSTGMPKGVAVNHYTLTNSTIVRNNYYEENINSFLLVPSFAFDSSIAVIWNTLTTGGTLHVVNNETLKNPEAILSVLKTQKIEGILGVPSFYKVIISDERFVEMALKRVILAGEALPKPLVALHYEKTTNCKLYNEYGPTENTVWASVCEIPEHIENITIGKPIDNSPIYVLSEEHALMPLGVVGELYIGGNNLAVGYLNREELTNEKFLPNPFRKGERMYKTGDLGKWTADGNIEFIGRADDQVKIRGYRVELGEIEKRLLELTYIKDAAVIAIVDAEGNKELVAFVVAEKALNGSDLRKDLEENLPAYMIPASFVQLDKIPLTKNGKVDKRYLENYEGETINSGVAYQEATTKEEKVLVNVLESVLKKQNISIEDSFYNLGGDSIKSILVISRLKQEGYALKIDDILRYPKLKDLATHMVAVTHIVDQSEVTGEVVLTPIQHYLFESNQIKNKTHYNQSVVLQSAVRINNRLLIETVEALVKHHDALRMRYEQTANGWTQINQKYSPATYEVSFHNLSEDDNAAASIQTIGQNLQTSFNLQNGPLIKVAHFKLKQEDRIAIIIHHLVIDGVSWRILLEDFATAYEQRRTGNTIKLPQKTNSFQDWAKALQQQAESDAMLAEKVYWEDLLKETITPIPIESTSESNTKFAQKEIGFQLSEETTQALQTKFHQVYNTNINEALLTGLALAIRDTYNLDISVIELEGHGREDILENTDISRTVGWFTTTYPVILNIKNTQKKSDALIAIKENYRNIPNKGIGYGMLKYLRSDVQLDVTPSLLFNYLGEFGAASSTENTETTTFNLSSDNIGRSVATENEESSLLNVSGIMTNGRLQMTIRYPEGFYTASTMQQLKDAFKENLEQLIAEIVAKEHAQLTPSDLTFKEITVEELSEITKKGTIEDIYKLSPLQQGIYYDWLTGSSSKLYFEQTSYRVEASIDIQMIEKAYQYLVAKHAALRTGFTNEYAGTPLQIVHKDLKGNFIYEKYQGEHSAEAMQAFTEKVRRKTQEDGFNLNDASLMKLHVLDFGSNRYEFIWSHHHILMDGWCVSILINDFYKIIASLQANEEVDITVNYKYSDYIQWLEKLNENKSLAYWKEYLGSYAEFVEIPFKSTENTTNRIQINTTKSFAIQDEVYDKLTTFCSEVAITQNTFLQTVWGYLLSKYNNTKDVVYGAVVSGRPAELDGIQDMIGLFVNTIPVRVQYENDTTVEEILKNVHQDTIAGNKHHYLTLSEVQSQSELGSDLINHLMIFENYHVQEYEEGEKAAETQEATNNTTSNGLTITGATNLIEQTNYDFNVVGYPENNALIVDFRYDNTKYDEAGVQSCLNHFHNLIEAFLDNKSAKLSDLDYMHEVEKQQLLLDFNGTNISYPKNVTVIDIFEKYATEHPHQTAIVGNEKNHTYAELNELATRYASYLQQEGVQQTDCVIISLPHNAEMMAALLAVKKIGAVCVPVDPSTPKERVNFYAENSHSVLKIDAETLKLMNAFEATSNVKIDRKAGNTTEAIIYTSGSTGVPKGVKIASQSVINRLNWMWETYPFEASEVCCAKTSLSFVDHIWEFFGPLLKGTPIVFYNKEEILEIPQFIEKLSKDKVSRIVLVPSLLRALLAEKELCQTKLQKLNLWVSSGEALKENDVQRFYNTFRRADIKLLNIYGSTEVTADATYYDTSEKYNTYAKFDLFKHSLKDEIDTLITNREHDDTIVANSFASLLESDMYKGLDFEKKYSSQEYIQLLKNEILPNVMNVAASKFIGHMTGPIPAIVRELGALVIALNQNQVKIETSMAATLIERQIIGYFHKLVFDKPTALYDETLQDVNHTFGIITNGGTISNITAVSYILNHKLGPKGNFKGIKKEGLIAALKYYGYENVALLGSKMCHYSFDKAMKLTGLGSDAFIEFDYDHKTTEEIHAEITNKIKALRAARTLVIGIVGIAGATESGNIDHLEMLGDIAKEHQLHFHVDAAFGGSFLMDDQLKPKFKGIAAADSVSICAHKQMYLPIGLSICLFNDTSFASASEHNSNYQARKGSYDLGKHTIEGTRNFNSLILHGILSTYGKESFAEVIHNNYQTAQTFAALIEAHPAFRLFYKPDLNIVLYQFIPQAYRNLPTLTDEDIKAINEVNLKIHALQLEKGSSFVSYTRIKKEQNEEDHVVMRTVFMNPYTTKQDLQSILEEQAAIATERFTGTQTAFQASNKNILIGKPIGNVQIYIMNEALEIVPIGVTGEICVSGDCVSAGYMNLDQKEQKFIENPFQKGAKLFRTGDLGKRLADGNIAYVGRKDDQIKIRGHRIELGEIEAQLKAMTAISEVVVSVRETTSGEKELMAFIVASSAITATEIYTHLAEKLPVYMIPAKFTLLDKIPLTVNGKVDKVALSKIEGTALNTQVEYVAPSTEEEKVLASILENILQTSNISMFDSFYLLGGNSITSLKVVSQLKKAGYDLEIKNLLNNPTIETIAKAMQPSKKEEITATSTDWKAQKVVNISGNQERFFRLPHSQVSFTAEIPFTTTIDFETSLRAFLEQFPMLRIQFANNGTTVTQQYANAAKVAIEIYDAATITNINERMHSEFDVYGALLRIFILEKDENSAKIVFSTHHALLDAYSNNAIETAFKAYFNGENVTTNSQEDYFSFVAWQQNFLNSAQAETTRNYWKNLLNKTIQHETTNSISLEVSGYVEQKIVLNSTKLQLLKELAASVGVPVSAVLYGYYQKLLQTLAPEKEIVGVMVNGREQQVANLEMETMIGVIDNLLPLPIIKNELLSQNELILQSYQQYLEARQYQQIPYTTMLQDAQHAYNKNIDAVMAGQFNYQIWQNKKHSLSQVYSTRNLTNMYVMPGIHLNCIEYANALEVTLVCSKEILEKMDDSFGKELFAEDLLSTNINA
ncbi:putative pyridoxal-dependent aspartate 1-decarboxylase [Kordia periserrulae]|uniref:Putative pyridoxal-dependent aspartate 1-decarboxylase n=1 Tax=Kordia periserrulae TaxID=701523 RepID=A0A2T6BZ75_9FLAO|nr:non-ribosomal peptide synthetase [Kordia periserrulae]PTX61374.1 putative pyridoxal-dependent aspartate 1-decarboxylase [Kordia periserrulae]